MFGDAEPHGGDFCGDSDGSDRHDRDAARGVRHRDRDWQLGGNPAFAHATSAASIIETAMHAPLAKKFTLTDLRTARVSGTKVPMLTCYDFTFARLMHQVGVPTILVGDSAGNVVLGHENTLPVPLHFMIQITAAVRRGAPNALLVADMPFGSYHGSVGRAVRNVFRMVQLSGC